jgi:hypothetical protein
MDSQDGRGPPVPIAHERPPRLDDEGLPILGPSGLFALPDTLGQQRRPGAVEPVGILGVKEIVSLTAQGFSGGPPKRLFSALVPIQDPTLEVLDQNRFMGDVQQSGLLPIALFALPQRLLCLRKEHRCPVGGIHHGIDLTREQRLNGRFSLRQPLPEVSHKAPGAGARRLANDTRPASDHGRPSISAPVTATD